MKTNQKQLKLIQYGLKPSTVTNLNESQVNVLYKKLLESKNENNEQVSQTTEPAKTAYKIGPEGGDLPNNPTGKGYKFEKNPDGSMKATPNESEMNEESENEIVGMGTAKGAPTQEPPQVAGSDGTDDEREGSDLDENAQLHEEIKNILEKFESKKQQKYFYAKCGKGKTKEEKKWCRMADEFAEKTNFKKLPEKKKEETNESGLSNYVKKVASAYAGGIGDKLTKTKITPTFAESELESRILRLVEKHITPKMSKKDFLNLVKEQGPSTAPTKPDVKPDVDTPTRPNKPLTPYQPKPGVKPAPKANKEAPVKPDIDTPTKPSKPSTPYQPKPGVKPAPKARKKMPEWLSFDEIGIKLK